MSLHKSVRLLKSLDLSAGGLLEQALEGSGFIYKQNIISATYQKYSTRIHNTFLLFLSAMQSTKPPTPKECPQKSN